MAEIYRSIHSGSNIDTAVSNVLNHTCGIQGVKVFGTELSKDSNNKVDVAWSNLVSQGTFTPLLGNSNTSCNYEYNSGTYFKFGELCYIAFRLKCKIVSVSGTTYATVRGLPFNAKTISNGSPEYIFSVGEFSQEGSSLTINGNITCNVTTGNSYVTFEHNSGQNAIVLQPTSSNFVWVSASGWYPIAS